MRRNGTVVERGRNVRVRRLLVATGLAVLVAAGPVVGAYAETPASGVTLSGRVVGPDGAGVRGASVTPQLAGASLTPVVTGADGTYALRDLVPGSYAFLVGARPDTGLMSGYYPDGASPEVPQRLTVTTASAQVVPDIRLQRGATVSGTVRRLDGTPVPHADVWVDLVGPGGYSFPATTDAYGKYRAVGVRNGKVTVWAGSTRTEWGSDYSGIGTFYAGATGTPRRTQATQVTTTAGAAVTGIDIRLPQRGTQPAGLALTLTPATPTSGRPVTVTVQASGAAGTPTGTIDLAGNGIVDDAALDAQGRATFTVTPDPGIDYVELTASYDGSATYASATGAIDFVPGEPVEAGPAPTVTSASPSTVSTVGGTRVTLTGTGFDSTASVSVDGAAAQDVVVDSATSLRATVPAHAAGAVPVVVTTRTGGPSAATSLTYAAVPVPPTVSAVWPAVLTTDGGVRVTVTGSGLADATAVTFGGTPGTGLQVVSATRVTVVAPARAAGAAPVRVTTPAGTSTTSRPFTYVDAADGVVSQTPQRAVSAASAAPGSPTCVQITGTNGVPTGASGVMVNVTTVRPASVGYVVVYPDSAGTGSTPPPPGSTVNLEPGADVANAAFVQLPANGKICWFIRSAGRVGILVDVTGFTMPDAGIVTQASQRLVDTRSGAGHVGSVTGPVAPRTVRTVQVRGMAGVPDDATAVILNATVTGATAPGNLRVYPAGQSVPTASVVNFAAGAAKANATIVDLPESGKVSFYSDTTASTASSPVQVILDVTGYVVGGATYSALTPTRVLDTRPGSGRVGSISGALSPGSGYEVKLAGRGGVPLDASAVVLNVTAIGPSGLGNLRVYPNATGSSTPPTASTINYIPGRDIPNLVVVALPADGIVTLYSDTGSGGTVHIAADVVGYVPRD